MVKFSTFERAIAQPDDELLLVQGGIPKRLPVSALGVRMAMGQTPPHDGSRLWLQTDAANLPVEPWFLHGSGQWLSQAAYTVDTYRGQVTGSTTRQVASPFLGYRVWIESFSAKCMPFADFAAGNVTDFQLRLVNSQRQQSVVWYLRLEDALKYEPYQHSEPVGLVVDAADALAIWFRVQRTGRTALRYVSMSAILRKVYDHASA
ncbi:MAG: hypothetical protein AAGC93_21285 [Cyanobacteria bacterium P01_F01_bin.53]